MTPEQRSAVYAFASATAPVFVAYGLVTDTKAAVLLGAFDGFLGAVTAWFNRPTKGA